MGCACVKREHNFREAKDLKTLLSFMEDENRFIAEEIDSMAADSSSNISKINFLRQSLNYGTENYNFLRLKSVDPKSEIFEKLKELVSNFYKCTNLSNGSSLELNSTHKELEEFTEKLYNK